MIIFHIFDFIFFIIRLGLVSSDISKDVSGTMSFLVPILIFDLLASVPIILCDIIYVIMRHCVKPLAGRPASFENLWRFGTMTCIRLHCHNERPQTILLMRVIFIVASIILKFICFVIGASCSARFKVQCTGYTVVAAFALVSSIILTIAEFIHFFRLWNYNPMDTRNRNNKGTIYVDSNSRIPRKTHRRHLGFIHYSLLNDRHVDGFRVSRCENGNNCKSSSLHHHLLYHTLDAQYEIDIDNLSGNEKNAFVAFYQTSKQEALDISEKGFPYGDTTDNKFKDYLHLKQNIFFTRSCQRELTTNKSSSEAIICVRLNLGRVSSVMDDGNLKLNEYFAYGDGKCDTIYVKSTRRFYLRMPAQIEKWLIAINENVQVDDNLDTDFYLGCS